MIINLCMVLKYLHVDKKIVHRDLNPANLMVDNQYNIKLADFGLAKTLSQSIPMMNSFVGTLVYSCPEIVQNKPYSEKAGLIFIFNIRHLVFRMLGLRANNFENALLKQQSLNFSKKNSRSRLRKTDN